MCRRGGRSNLIVVVVVVVVVVVAHVDAVVEQQALDLGRERIGARDRVLRRDRSRALPLSAATTVFSSTDFERTGI